MKRKGFYRFHSVLVSSDFCAYCGTSLQEWEKVVDHFYPVSAGGRDMKCNLFVSCRECNAIKTDLVFSSHSEARQWILPRKKKHATILDNVELEEQDVVNDTMLVLQNTISSCIDEYKKLRELDKYDSCIYVHGIGNISTRRRKLVQYYLLTPYLKLSNIGLIDIFEIPKKFAIMRRIDGLDEI